MKVLLWIFAVVGTLYNFMYLIGNETVVKYAVGPLYFLMQMAFLLFVLLIVHALGKAAGFFRG